MCVHLHVHSEFSILDGLSRIHDLVATAKEQGANAIALTDHGVLSGIPHLLSACEKAEIKPIIGCEVYTTECHLKKGEYLKERRDEIVLRYNLKDKALKAFLKVADCPYDQFIERFMEQWGHFFVSIPDWIHDFRKDIIDYMKYENYHLLLLAKNTQGMKDLYRIVSQAHIEGFYFSPRIDLNFIESNGLGKHLIASSGCLAGWFAHLIRMNEWEMAKQYVMHCQKVFHLFVLEKQATSIPEQIALNRAVDQMAKETGIPVILTTDVHYVKKDDHELHDVLVSMSTGKCISDENRMKYAHEFWLKSNEEMLEKENDPQSLVCNQWVADQVELYDHIELLFPVFDSKEEDPIDFFRKKCWNGLLQYAFSACIDMSRYQKQLIYEMDIIIGQGFVDYFLIVSDFITWAKEHNCMVGPGRGSAAGSLVSFCLGITELDPIKWGLIFERFLNPDRIELPDIDVDFSYESAKQVIQYLKETYGSERVAQIGTMNTLAARSAIRMVGKTLGMSLLEQDAFAKAIPDVPKITLREASKEENVQKWMAKYPDWWDKARGLEGSVRAEGVHAGGVVISPVAMTDVVPLRLDKEDGIVTQFDMNAIQERLVKFDILKLDTLDLIQLCKTMAGIESLDLMTIDLNDPVIYERVYQKGWLSGIFQVESDGMKKAIEELKPNSIEEISTILALYRPGPMDWIPNYINRKFGREKVTYLFDELTPLLKDTYGIFVYQEQIMEASRVIGGFTMSQSDILRKAIGKKKMDLIDEWINYMIYGNANLGITGGIQKGFDESKLLLLKEQWLAFGLYAFNRAHTACYAVLSVQTAYLKAYYPCEFMASLMTISQGKKKDDVSKNVYYIRECEEMGIQILPPDINESKAHWTANPIEKNIRFGLTSIGNLSGETIYELEHHQPYESIEDAVQKIGGRKLNKTKIIALIRSGCFDFVTKNRNGLLKSYLLSRKEDISGYKDTTSKKDLLEMELELLGMPISVKSKWDKLADGKENIQLSGQVIRFEQLVSKKGKKYGVFFLETDEDERKCIVFDPNLRWAHQKMEQQQCHWIVKGTKSKQDLIVHSIKLKEES